MEQRSKELLRLEHKDSSLSPLESALLLCNKDSSSLTKKPPSDGTPLTAPLPPSQLFQPINIPDFIVPELNGDNYRIWKENILFQLGWMDIDYAIRKDEPPMPTDTSSQVEIALYERWERSNRLSMMYIKTKISASMRVSLGECKNVRELLKAINEEFKSLNKALAITLMTKFSSMKLTSIRGVREHIEQMSDIAVQLNLLDIEICESVLFHFIMYSLPPQYGLLKSAYYAQEEEWSINRLLTMCVQEEEKVNNGDGREYTYGNPGKE
ncbi:Retrovirus-related Pol polyprotein from transposon TNT 1-94 [Senna tora]|uniref:Retrovirus-related Pol polyprotein from transposon TNT 1-94 n=1 Tax=Senna tora TaxID=362788 RepID=A0A835CI16_9FABA|nr:Retrovirus-related Pol polyprotein from transposon TNT 1-94 [Senna tora]